MPKPVCWGFAPQQGKSCRHLPRLARAVTCRGWRARAPRLKRNRGRHFTDNEAETYNPCRIGSPEPRRARQLSVGSITCCALRVVAKRALLASATPNNAARIDVCPQSMDRVSPPEEIGDRPCRGTPDEWAGKAPREVSQG